MQELDAYHMDLLCLFTGLQTTETVIATHLIL